MRIMLLMVAATALLIVIAGCSSGSNTPVSPLDNETSSSIESLPIIGASLFEDGSFNALGILGAYELSINPEDNTAELVAKRTSAIGESYVVSGIGFFTISPCANCLNLKSIGLNLDGNVVLIFEISHPFEKGIIGDPPTGKNRLDLDVFDLALVVVPSEITSIEYSQSNAYIYSEICVNPDGYTTELDEILNDGAALPYFLVIDDSITGTSTNNKFEMGSKDVEFNAIFDLSAGTLRFDLYLTMGYGYSAVKADRLNPVYYIPEFNRKAAWKVSVIPPEGDDPPALGNTWQDDDDSTTFDVTVEVYDWQVGANVDPALTNPTDIYAASDVASVSVEIPGMNTSLPSVTTADSGLGTPDDPLVYKVPIANENLLGVGKYTGLVKVTDERTVGTIGDRDFLIDNPTGFALENYDLPEFATYQTFTATVVPGFVLSERIVYSSRANGQLHIYSIDPEGVAPVEQWTNTIDTVNNFPKLSPCGGYIIYMRYTMAADFRLRIIDIEADTDTQITPAGYYSYCGCFSHDGTNIAAVLSTSNAGPYDLWTHDYDGNNPVRLTTGQDANSLEYNFDDSQIYYSNNLVAPDIRIYDVATGLSTDFTDNGLDNHFPSGSPDGTQIAWDTSFGGPGRRTYISPVAGPWNPPDKVIDFNSMVRCPSYNPDGTKMVVYFGGGTGTELAICDLSVDPYTWTQITDNACEDMYPNWGVMIPH